MALSIYQRKKLAVASYIIGAGAFLGPFYALFSDGFGSWFPYINGFIIGILVAVFIAWVELVLLPGQMRFLKFYKILLLRTLLYATVIPLLIFSVFLLSRVYRFNLSVKAAFYSDEFQNYLLHEDFDLVIIYTLALAFVASFTYQLSRKMGQGMFLNFVTGRFYQPVVDEKIFMFLQIHNSDQVIKKIGRLNFHELLKEVSYRITPVILAHYGIIHHYVEDEIVVYWSKSKGYKNAHCVRLFYAIHHHFEGIKQEMYSKYEAFPVFYAAIHAGEVVQGEIGEIKSEIAFYGDVMNTASRMLALCHSLSKPVLVSGEVRSNTTLPSIFQWVDCDSQVLRGKRSDTHLFSLEEVELPAS